MDDIPSVKDIVGINIFISDINLIDDAMVGLTCTTKHQKVSEDCAIGTI